jgi:hypothetical protein
MLPIKTSLNRSGIALVAVFSFLTLIAVPAPSCLAGGAPRKHRVAQGPTGIEQAGGKHRAGSPCDAFRA